MKLIFCVAVKPIIMIKTVSKEYNIQFLIFCLKLENIFEMKISKPESVH